MQHIYPDLMECAQCRLCANNKRFVGDVDFTITISSCKRMMQQDDRKDISKKTTIPVDVTHLVGLGVDSDDE